MVFLTYAGIFIFKMIEEALRTLRIIVVSNGKKILGSILQFFIALIWIIVTGTVISNVQDDPLKIVFYALGSLIGSYFGSTLEEKIALGSLVSMVEVNENISFSLLTALKKAKFSVTSVKGSALGKQMLMITSPRKKADEVVKIIRNFDKKAKIIEQNVRIISHRI